MTTVLSSKEDVMSRKKLAPHPTVEKYMTMFRLYAGGLYTGYTHYTARYQKDYQNYRSYINKAKPLITWYSYKCTRHFQNFLLLLK